MANELGQMDGSDRKTPDRGESIYEFYVRVRGNEIVKITKYGYEAAYDSLSRFMIDECELESDEPAEEVNKQILNLTSDEVRNWCRWMVREQQLKPSSADDYLSHIAMMIDDLKGGNYIGGQANPFGEVADSKPFDYDSGAVWPEIPYEELVDAINSIKSPKNFTIIATLAKTGLRRAEAGNLDERDINIDHPVSQVIDDPRREIIDKSNTIYVDSSITKGEIHNGEERTESNKKKSYRAIPIDDELVDTLGWYLSCRPRSERDSKPIFTGINDQNGRVGGSGIYRIVDNFQENQDLGESVGISPHFFRHFYTTQLRSSLSTVDPQTYPGTPKQIVKGLRGDSDDDTIETYSHDWDEGLEDDVGSTDDLIRECIPKLFN